MLSRRMFVGSSMAAGMAALLPVRALAAVDPKLSALFDRIVQTSLRHSPVGASYLGLDTGPNAGLRSQLGDSGAKGRAETVADIAQFSGWVSGFDRSGLSDRDGWLLDSLDYLLANARAGERFAYGSLGTFGGGTPYVVTQQDDAYQALPEFLDSVHRVENRADAEAYLSRLAAAGGVLDQETEQLKADAARGVVPPDFLMDTAIGQMKELRGVDAAQSRLVRSLTDRTGKRGLPGDYAGRATAIVQKSFYPALDRQIAAMVALRAKATPDAGVWKLPEGGDYYRWALQYATSTDLTPEAIHQMGLDQGRDLDARMDGVLKAQGMAQGTVGERMSALTRDPKQLFANTDAGKAEAIAYVQQKLDTLRGMMPLYSRMKLKADLQVKRVPVDIEKGAALGYMNFASLDGSRPAIYYINLHDTANWPRFTIPSLTAHEGIPGHAWQGAYMAEHRDDVPLISSLLGFNAYTEGWALYAEQLVDELGFYRDDPFGQLGMLQALRFRASRLVTDTGLHAKKWTRGQAVDYMTSSTGRARSACQSEVDRYCASPGQACGYKVGHSQIVRLREKAKAELGAAYDVRDYNDAVIRAGAMPLAVLEKAVDSFIAERKKS